MHKIVYLAVNIGNILVIFFTSENSHREQLSIYESSCVSIKHIFVGLEIIATAAELCQNVIFLLAALSPQAFLSE